MIERKKSLAVLVLAELLSAATSQGARAGTETEVAAQALELSFRSQLTVGQGTLAVRAGGELQRSEPWLKNGESWRSFRLVDAEVSLWRNGQQQDSLAAAGEVFAVRSGPLGELIELAFPAAMPPDTRAFVQALAGLMQIVCPERAGANTWKSQERDGSGRYDARYQRLAGGWTKKTKLRYVGAPLTLSVVRSEINFKGECPAGRLDEIAAAEILAEDALGLRAQSSLSLRRHPDAATAAARLPAALPTAHDRRAPGAVTASPSRPSDADEIVRLETALEQMRSSSSSTFPWKVTMALSGRLRGHPEELGKLESSFRALPERVPALGQVLVNIDTAASLDVLDRLLEDEALPDGVRRQLLTELLWAPSAHRSTIDRVHALADCGREALAAVAANTEGSLLAKARRAVGEDVASLIRRYLAAFRHASTSRLRGAYLDGLSYIGGREALAEIHGSLADGDAAVRVRAVGALEGTKDLRAETWVVERLRADPDEGVRERAARACGSRGTRPCMQALDRALRRDRGTRVRLRAVDGLASTPSGREGDRALARASRADANAAVRDAAKRALERLAEQRRRRAGRPNPRPTTQPG